MFLGSLSWWHSHSATGFPPPPLALLRPDLRPPSLPDWDVAPGELRTESISGSLWKKEVWKIHGEKIKGVRLGWQEKHPNSLEIDDFYIEQIFCVYITHAFTSSFIPFLVPLSTDLVWIFFVRYHCFSLRGDYLWIFHRTHIGDCSPHQLMLQELRIHKL